MISFEIYDNNELIFKGKAKDVAYKFNIVDSSLYNYYCKGHKIGKKYDVKRVVEEPVKKEEPVKVKLTEHEKLIDYITRHLDAYGNVYVKKDPRPLLKELEKLGYKCKVDEYHMPDDSKITLKKDKKRKMKYMTDYVLTLEVANGTKRKSQSI